MPLTYVVFFLIASVFDLSFLVVVLVLCMALIGLLLVDLVCEFRVCCWSKYWERWPISRCCL